MSKKTIAVLFGGVSTEHEVSVMSAMNVISALSPEKYYILPIYITKEGRWLLYDGATENIRGTQWDKVGVSAVLSPDLSHGGLLRLVAGKAKTVSIDAVFPVLHGKNGEDGTIQGLCELAGIPCVGCGMLASACAMDKAVTNILAKAEGLPHTPYIVVHKSDLEDPDVLSRRVRSKLGFPCFVKPANAGSSVGVTKAVDKKELFESLDTAFAFDNKVIIEKAVNGRELECAVLGGAEPMASPIGEVLSAGDFYDYESKYNNAESKTVIPADIPEEVSTEIQSLALRAFKAIGGEGMARVDFFLEDATNRIFFNEINTIPGFTAISLYPALWAHAGVDTPTLCDKLIDIALLKKG